MESISPIPVSIQLSEYEEKKMHFFQVGNLPDFPLLVFVHGSPGSLIASSAYLKDLRFIRKADMIAMDRLGFGYSDYGNAEGNLAEQASSVVSILSNHRKRPIILVGHSMGAPIISKIAMMHPRLVVGLILVAPSIAPEWEPPVWWRKVLNVPPICCLTPPAFRVCNQEIIPLKSELTKMKNNWHEVVSVVTVIQGTDDNLVDKENARFAKDQLVNALTLKIKEISGGDHFVYWNEHDLVVDEILAVLDYL